MQRYKDFRPTAFDSRGAFLDDRQDWFVVSVSRTRDSGPLAESNFETALKILDGEQEDLVEVHRFGHWGPGWFEIIIVHPSLEDKVQEIEDSLENYPVLDEQDYSQKEWEEYIQGWESWGARDFVKELVRVFELGPFSSDLLSDADNENLREFYEELASEPYISEDSGVSIPVGRAVERCTMKQLIIFLTKLRRKNGTTGEVI